MSTRSICLLACLALLPLGAAHAQPKLDLAAIVKDTQQMQRRDDHLTLVLWMPEEYWRAALESSGRLTSKGVTELLQSVHPYTMLAVMDAQIGAAATFDFADEASLRDTVTLEDASGQRYTPIPLDSLNAATRNVMQAMRPVLSNAMGQMGAHLTFLAFPGDGKNGQRLAEAAKAGAFKVHVRDVDFRYRLPIGSVLPPVVDSTTGEIFPGNYHFSPFTGNKLVPAPTTAQAK